MTDNSELIERNYTLANAHGWNRSNDDVDEALKASADALASQAARIAELEAERDAAFSMSSCECGTDECCKNLVSHLARAEKAESRVSELERQIADLKKEAERVTRPKPLTVERMKFYLDCCSAGDVPNEAQALVGYLCMDGYALSERLSDFQG